ncbi:FecR family protein [Parapedobacter lycopersici]|uniref:FecR family protein n=1 Tax=Parapedobacter lycopersici TaxID=1864939 RepID=UPI00214DDFBF|nr:FecR family protein [Parapedobacter lycopersici]
MSTHRFNHLFQQYINETATPEEVAEFLSMVRQEQYREIVQDHMDSLWESPFTFASLSAKKKATMFNDIVSVADNSRSAAPAARRHWFSIAAAILIISSFLFFYSRKYGRSDRMPVDAATSRVVQSTDNELRFITLSDGSSVVLNQRSTLEISETFDTGKVRAVYLTEGEAFFEVTHNATRPFIVYTGKLRTTVLGTAFSIKASPGASMVTVTVTKGKVKVGDDSRTFDVLDPDEQAIYQHDRSSIKKQVDAKQAIAWKNEDIFFDNVNLKSVSDELHDRFGVTFVFANETIKTCRFSATFLKSQSLEQILTVIAEFNNIKYRFLDKKTIELDGTGCV